MQKNELEINQAKQKQRFSIRKLSIGAASVMIGSFLYLGGNANNVMADTPDLGSASPTLVENNDEKLVAENTTDKQTENTQDQQEPAATPAKQDSDMQEPVSAAASTDNKSEQQIAPAQESAAQSNIPAVQEDSQPVDSNNNSEQAENADPTMTQAKKEAKVNPVVAIKGEVPTLDPNTIGNAAFDYANNLQTDLPTYEGDPIHVEWTKAPDVSKIGNTSGEALLTYTTYNDEGNEMTNQLPVTINVKVVDGQVKQADQVRNTLTIVDQDNQPVFNYTWLHDKPTEEDGDMADNPAVSANGGELIKSNLAYLGLSLVPNNDNYSVYIDPWTDLGSFGTTDKTDVLYVNRPTGITIRKYDDSNQDDYLSNEVSYSNSSSINLTNPRATDYVNGLINLQPGDSVDWGTKPEFKMDNDTGSYELSNDPTIVIKHADGTSEAVDNSADLKTTLNYVAAMIGQSSTNAEISSPVTIDLNESDSLPDAKSLVKVASLSAYDFTDYEHPLTGNQLQDAINKYYDVNWDIEPSLNYPGYQLAYVNLTLNQAGQNMINNGNSPLSTDAFGQQPFQLQVLVIPKKETVNTQVQENITYVFEDENGQIISTEATDSQSLTFTGSQYNGSNAANYPDETESFKAVNITPQTGFDLVSATDTNNGADVLDKAKKQIIAIGDILYSSKNIEIKVVFKKNAPAVKTITETIHYVYPDDSQAQPDYTKTLTFTKVKTNGIWGPWSPADSQTFQAVASPAIADYTPSLSKIAEQTVSPESQNLVFTVVYAKNAPAIDPTPQTPSQNDTDDTQQPKAQPAPTIQDNNLPEIKDTKTTISSDQNKAPWAADLSSKKTNQQPQATSTIQPKAAKTSAAKTGRAHSARLVKTNAKVKNIKMAKAKNAVVDKSQATTLPQTGEKENMLGLIGLGLGGLVAIIGLAEKKRRN